MVDIGILENIDIFKNFEVVEIEKVAEICATENYQVGENLFLEGDDATDMWIVLEGNVELRFEMPNAKISTSETALSSHNKDIPESEVFGWSCFTEPYKMKLSAYCTSRRCKVLKINAAMLNKLMAKDTAIGFKIMSYIVQVVGYRFKQMKEEVAKFMGVNMMNSW